MARDRSDTLRKVQALLDKANGTQFDAERDAFMAKADALMAAYAIESFELDMARPSHEREKPVLQDIVVSTASDWQVRYQLDNLFNSLADHVGVMIGGRKYGTGNEMIFTCVGYKSDIDYLQMLYVTIQMHLVGKMEPKPVPTLSEAENFMALRESGISYERIRQLMGWVNGDGKLMKARKQYLKQCAAEGRNPVTGAKTESYRISFLTGFVRRIKVRLGEMAEARSEASTGKGLVLASRDGDIKEVFWDAFPDQRPHPDDCECDSCKNRNKPVRYRAVRTVKMDAQGYDLGTTTANSANLNVGRGVGGQKGALS